MSNKTLYVCSACDAQFLKWSGRCLECGGWGTLELKTVEQKQPGAPAAVSPAEMVGLNELSALGQASRLITGVGELDRVLGHSLPTGQAGIMPGSLILLGGEPGIGKSTLVAQIADRVARNSQVIYVSGEESAGQIKARFDRLGIGGQGIKFTSQTSAEKIIAAINQLKPGLVIIDSIQTIYSDKVAGEAGGLNQIRGSAASFLESAKGANSAIILIGHITKDGALAGPKTLEHIVDTVLYLETEPSRGYRILSAAKNRFGSVDEIGIFEMTGAGFKEVANPSQIFLESGQNLTGSVISCIIEGTRAFLIEVQALVTKTVFGYPQRKASGFDLNRLSVLIAVLTKRANLNLTTQDVILNVVGGLKISDPSLDLAVSLAMASSLLNQVVNNKTIVLGEVGLGGEVRPVGRLEARLNEAEKLGFKKAIIPPGDCVSKKLELVKIKNISELIKHLTEK